MSKNNLSAWEQHLMRRKDQTLAGVRSYGISPEQKAPDADAYRLWQAGELLREAGFVEQPDGTWLEGKPDGGDEFEAARRD